MSKNTVKQQAKKERRARRTRSRLLGTSARPRLSVNRSLKHISAQIIDDTTGKTLAASSDTVLETKGKKTDVAVAVGTDIAKKAQAAGIKTIVFDRGSCLYHGRIKALAEAARAEGLEF